MCIAEQFQDTALLKICIFANHLPVHGLNCQDFNKKSAHEYSASQTLDAFMPWLILFCLTD